MIIKMLYAFIATIMFSIVFNVPKKFIITCGMIGCISWTTYYVAYTNNINLIASYLIASILISVLSEIIARQVKEPVIMFLTPGILTLAPGLKLYNTIFELIQKNYEASLNSGLNVLLIGFAITIGILLVSSFGKLVKIKW